MKLLTSLILGFSLLLSSLSTHAFFPYDFDDVVITSPNLSPVDWDENSVLNIELSYNSSDPTKGSMILDHTQSLPGPNDTDPNTKGWPRITINGTNCCNAIVWVMARLDATGPNGEPDGQLDDVWYAATWEYLAAQNRPPRSIKALEGGHTQTNEFRNPIWKPKFGDYIGLMVSTFARNSGTPRPNLLSRSNMVLIKWGEQPVDLSTADPCEVAEMIGSAEPEECKPEFDPGVLNILLDDDDPVPQLPQ